MGNIRLRLVIVIVTDKIGNGVVGEEITQLLVKLSRQGFVVTNDESGQLGFFNDVSNGVGFAATGDTNESLVLVPRLDRFGQKIDRVWLIAGWLIISFELEIHALYFT